MEGGCTERGQRRPSSFRLCTRGDGRGSGTPGPRNVHLSTRRNRAAASPAPLLNTLAGGVAREGLARWPISVLGTQRGGAPGHLAGWPRPCGSSRRRPSRPPQPRLASFRPTSGRSRDTGAEGTPAECPGMPRNGHHGFPRKQQQQQHRSTRADAPLGCSPQPGDRVRANPAGSRRAARGARGVRETGLGRRPTGHRENPARSGGGQAEDGNSGPPAQRKRTLIGRSPRRADQSEGRAAPSLSNVAGVPK